MKSNKIAVLTSGGDAQGMNTCLAIIVRVAKERGIKVLGVKSGYKGLYEDDFIDLDIQKVTNIESLGGSILKTSRFLDFMKDSVVKKCAENLKRHKVDALIVLGGDGSFRGCRSLIAHGVNVIGIPCTVDNDLRYTERCLGFDSAVNNACHYMLDVKQSMQSLSRGVVYEVMGRYCGDIALYSATSTACDILALPEKKITEKDIIKKAKALIAKGHIPTIVVAEKLFDVCSLATKLTKATGVDFKYSIVGYIQRGGEPTVADKTLAMEYAVRAMQLVSQGIYNKAIGISGRKVFEVSFDDVENVEYNFNEELYNLFQLLNE